MKKIGVFIVWIVFITFCALAGFTLDLMLWADDKVSGDPGEKIFSVLPGQGFRLVSDNLHREGLIENPLKFMVLARLKENDKKIKAGEYLVPLAVSPNRMLAILTKGRVRLHRLTIPEGMNLRQIADIVEKSGFGSAQQFYQLTTDKDLVSANHIPAGTFEGYLFPDTYSFPKDVPLRQILQAMADRFQAVYSPEWRVRSQQLGFTVHQIVTLASIIEKETGTGSERPVISSVFHNRLKRGMRLEADPTVIYGIKDFNGNITRKDLETATPYNTYKIKGLPPGPIANPGSASLKAALYPADTKYIYFVSKKDSTHYFSTNFKEHKRAVRKYQLGKKN